MRFEFATSSRIIFGRGTLKEAAPLVAAIGRRALLVTGRSPQRSLPLAEDLATAGVNSFRFAVPGEPTVPLVEKGLGFARDSRCDLVIGIGGGSVLDAAKAVAALLTNSGGILDYLEVVGRGKDLRRDPAPCVAIPTTAGTGAEVTRNAVLSSPAHQVKVSMRSAAMLPDLAIIDPELTYSMPPAVTAATGLDALTQVLESYVSSQANPLTDALCLDGMKRAAGALRQAFADGGDAEARENMCLVSLYGGLALANAKLGAVHGFAGPIGAMFNAPHGMVCASLLPHVMQTNIRALRRQDLPLQLNRFADVAAALTGNPAAQPEDGTAWALDLCQDLQVPKLTHFGITADRFGEIVAKSKAASSMRGNPVPLSDDDLTRILEQAF